MQMYDRRDLIGMGAALMLAPGSLFGATDFWNKKPSSGWSADEIELLKSKSPWAKKVRAEVAGGGSSGAPSMDRAGSKGTFGGMTGADSNGISAGGGRGSRGGGAESGTQGPEVVVRWESAAPLLEATKTALPPSFENRYAVSVTGVPRRALIMALNAGTQGRGDPAIPEDPAARQKAAVDRLLSTVTLTVKGRAPQQADLLVESAAKDSLIFAFPKQSLALTASDREVAFDMNLGVMRIKAKFDLKEMVYKEQLAV